MFDDGGGGCRPPSLPAYPCRADSEKQIGFRIRLGILDRVDQPRRMAATTDRKDGLPADLIFWTFSGGTTEEIETVQ